MNILILANAPTLDAGDADRASEAGVLESVEAIRGALTDSKHALRSAQGRATHNVAVFLVKSSIAELVRAVEGARADVVVNLCEAFGGKAGHEPNVAGVLEMSGVAFTGSPPDCLALCRNKPRTKWLMQGAGVPTADFYYADGLLSKAMARKICSGGESWIVKPAAEDASLGITRESVVSDAMALVRQVERVQQAYGPALIERYIVGREFNVAILDSPEPRVLPLAEILFEAGCDLVTYDAKWTAESAEYHGTPVACPADVDAVLAARIREAALAVYRLTGCRDYARVDLRVNDAGEVFVLEVNPNPDLSPTAGFARAAAADGLAYEGLVEVLIANAFKRAATKKDSPPCSAAREMDGVMLRIPTAEELEALVDVLRAAPEFRPDEVDVGEEVLREFFEKGAASGYAVTAALREGKILGWECHGLVPLTDATFDLYWIVVLPDARGQGVGRALLEAAERDAREAAGRWLLAETSGTEAYGATQAFYERCGYERLSEIADFYRAGDSRLIYGKRLSASAGMISELNEALQKSNATTPARR